MDKARLAGSRLWRHWLQPRAWWLTVQRLWVSWLHASVRCGLVIILLVTLAACTPFGFPQRATPDGTLRWSLEGMTDLPSLDPATPHSQAAVTVIKLIFAGLVRLDSELRIQPDGAERWEVSSDGKTYTFFLRPNLTFGDGTRVTAEDFRYSINRALASETASFATPAHLGHIVGSLDVSEGRTETACGVRVLDATTLQIELEEPQANFLARLAAPYAFAVPAHLIEQQGDNWIAHAYGTGPFRVREWQRNEGIVLEANHHYWRGSPGVAVVRMPFTRNGEEAYQQYLQGELDIVGNNQIGIPVARVAAAKSLPGYRSASATIVQYVGFNNSQPPFDNIYVRQAFALTVDRRELTQNILVGTASATNRILPEGVGGASLPVRGLNFNPVDAQAALGLAGYASGQELPPVTLTYDRVGDNTRVALALQRFWQRNLGVAVAIEGLDRASFMDRLDRTYQQPERADGLQMYLGVWGAAYPNPQNVLSQQLHTLSPNNSGHWSNPRFDHLVEQADRLVREQDYEQRLQLYNEAEQIALSEVGWLPLYTTQSALLVRPTIRGLDVTPLGIDAADWTQVRIVERRPQ